MKSSLKIVSLVEATAMNAVAKIVLGFFRTTGELSQSDPEFPLVQGSIITFDRSGDGNPPNEFVTAARAAGLEIDLIPEQRRFDLAVIPALHEAIEKHRPDIVITNSVKSHFLFWRTRLGKKYPWVAFHHGYTTTDLKMRIYNRLDRWSLPKADRVATVCQVFASELAREIEIPEEKICVQHNAIRPRPKPSEAEISELKRHVATAEHDRLIISIGRLSKEKAHGVLIEAFRLLRTTNPNLSC